MPLHEHTDDGMLRMSILEHLEELRSRLIRSLVALAIAYALCLIFADAIWSWIQAPLDAAAAATGARIVALTVGEQFSVLYLQVPLLAAIFVAAPAVLYQAWAFLAPGLYPRERHWAVPFLLSTAGLFLAGGAFCYYVALRYSLVFLVGVGRNAAIDRFVSISSYFDTFVNMMLGIAVAFELPVVIFFLTLLRIVTPGFLMRNARYAVLAVAVLAAAVTPSPSAVDMAMFFVPMLLLYFLGVFASYLLVLRREDQPFPWREALLWLGASAAVSAGATLAYRRYARR